MKAFWAFTGVLRIFDNKKVDRDIVDNHTNKLRKSLATSQHPIRARKDVWFPDICSLPTIDDCECVVIQYKVQRREDHSLNHLLSISSPRYTIPCPAWKTALPPATTTKAALARLWWRRTWDWFKTPPRRRRLLIRSDRSPIRSIESSPTRAMPRRTSLPFINFWASRSINRHVKSKNQ